MTFRIETIMYDVTYGHADDKRSWRSFGKRTQYLSQAIKRAKQKKAEGYDVEVLRVKEISITETEVWLEDSDFNEE